MGRGIKEKVEERVHAARDDAFRTLTNTSLATLPPVMFFSFGSFKEVREGVNRDTLERLLGLRGSRT